MFDSVYRSIVERNLNGIWIRRGLWTNAQDNTIPLDRERYFTRVIVPGEALPELDRPVSSSMRIVHVGPIVRRLGEGYDRAAVRSTLAQHFGRDFETLIVTMLGSGAYVDVSSQLQTVAAFAEGRRDCLNLVVVWPGSTVPAARFAWKNSRVVTTTNATLLAGAADVMVSAAGYNSFCEALYNRIPTIFVPQVATWLDDQVARAGAAERLGLAGFVPPERPGQVGRALTRFLDGGRLADVSAALAAATLPGPGTQDAARIIAEAVP